MYAAICGNGRICDLCCDCDSRLNSFVNHPPTSQLNVLLEFPFTQVATHKIKYCWWKKSCTSWHGKYPIMFRVSYMSAGAGFLPSTVAMRSSWQWGFPGASPPPFPWLPHHQISPRHSRSQPSRIHRHLSTSTVWKRCVRTRATFLCTEKNVKVIILPESSKDCEWHPWINNKLW